MILVKDNVVKIKEDVREIEHLLALGYKEVKPVIQQEEPTQEVDEQEPQKESTQELTRSELFAALKELGVPAKGNASNVELKELYEKAKGE